mgnify:CR=1 FL=1
MIKRDKNHLFVEIKGKKMTINILEKYLFTSDRKRMSVIGEWDNRIILYTKGVTFLLI